MMNCGIFYLETKFKSILGLRLMDGLSSLVNLWCKLILLFTAKSSQEKQVKDEVILHLLRQDASRRIRSAAPSADDLLKAALGNHHVPSK